MTEELLMGDQTPAYFVVEVEQTNDLPSERMTCIERCFCVFLYLWVVSFAFGSYAIYNYEACLSRKTLLHNCHTPFVLMWSLWASVFVCSIVIVSIGCFQNVRLQ